MGKLLNSLCLISATAVFGFGDLYALSRGFERTEVARFWNESKTEFTAMVYTRNMLHCTADGTIADFKNKRDYLGHVHLRWDPVLDVYSYREKIVNTSADEIITTRIEINGIWGEITVDGQPADGDMAGLVLERFQEVRDLCYPVEAKIRSADRQNLINSRGALAPHN